jgi:hypothetical protein
VSFKPKIPPKKEKGTNADQKKNPHKQRNKGSYVPSHGVFSGPNIVAFQTNRLSSLTGLALAPYKSKTGNNK